MGAVVYNGEGQQQQASFYMEGVGGELPPAAAERGPRASSALRAGLDLRPRRPPPAEAASRSAPRHPPHLPQTHQGGRQAQPPAQGLEKRLPPRAPPHPPALAPQERAGPHHSQAVQATPCAKPLQGQPGPAEQSGRQQQHLSLQRAALLPPAGQAFPRPGQQGDADHLAAGGPGSPPELQPGPQRLPDRVQRGEWIQGKISVAAAVMLTMLPRWILRCRRSRRLRSRVSRSIPVILGFTLILLRFCWVILLAILTLWEGHSPLTRCLVTLRPFLTLPQLLPLPAPPPLLSPRPPHSPLLSSARTHRTAAVLLYFPPMPRSRTQKGRACCGRRTVGVSADPD